MRATQNVTLSVHSPLTPAVFHILLTLAPGQKHGYAIMKQVEEDAGGTLRMGPGTLYGTLGRMVAAGLVKEVEQGLVEHNDVKESHSTKKDSAEERRRYYQISSIGERALGAELSRLRHALATAKRKGVPVPSAR